MAQFSAIVCVILTVFHYVSMNLCYCNVQVTGEIEQNQEIDNHFESLHFQIATDINSAGRSCLEFSRFFCLMLWTTTEKRQRVPQLGDRDEFWNFTINSYSRYNWFSFNDNDAGHCCYYQVSMYLLEGRSNGFTPAEAIVSLFSFFQ